MMDSLPWQLRALIIFVVTALTVLGLAYQSLNVNTGRKKDAVVTSFLVSLVYLIVLKAVPSSEGFWESAGYVMGGPVGVYYAMKLFER